MRKLTKLLAIIMVACLLCGAIAMTAFAADEATTKSFLDITDASKGVVTQKYQDYNGTDVVFDKATNGETIIQGKNNLWNSVDATIEGTLGDNYLKLSLNQNSERANPTANGNFLIDINYDTGASGAAAPADAYCFFQGGLDKNKNGARFLTLDFDLAATHYVFTINGAKYNVEEIKTDENGNEYIVLPEAIADATTVVNGENRYAVTEESVYDLSYVETTFAPVAALYTNGTCSKANSVGASGNLNNYFNLAKQDGYWGLVPASAGNGVTDEFVPLSQKAGEWNHITLVFGSTYAATGDTDPLLGTQLAYFVNGDYVGHCFKNNSNATDKSVTLTGLLSTITAANLASDAAYFSMGIDNIAVNTYAMSILDGADYSTEDTLYGWWKTWFPGNKQAEKANTPLLQEVAKDIAYNPATYMNPNELYTVTENNGTPVRYATVNALIAALKATDDTLSLEASSSKAIENYNPDSSIKQVTIYAPSVTLSDEAIYHNCVEEEPGKWVVKKVSLLYVEFYDENDNLIEGSFAGHKPDTDPAGIIPEGYGEPVMIEGKYYDRVWVHEDMNLDSDTFGDMIPLAAMDEGVMSWYDYYSIDEPMPVYLTLVEDTTKTLVTWLDADGDVYKKAWLTIGDTLVHPTAEEMEAAAAFLEKTGNGWYNKHYNAWAGKDGADMTTVTANAVFEVDKATFKPIEALDGVRYTFVLTGNSTPQIYSPVVYNKIVTPVFDEETGEPVIDEETGVQKIDITYEIANKTFDGKDIPAEVEYLGFVDDEGNRVTSTYAKVGNDYLNMKTGNVLPANALTSSTVQIGFKVNGEVLIKTVTVGFEKYANAILDDPATANVKEGAYDCGSEESVLALAMLNFINNNASSPIAAATAIMDKHTDCACVEAAKAIFNYEYTVEEGKDKGADESRWAALEAAGVTGIAYSFTINQPNIVLQIPVEKLYIPTILEDGTADYSNYNEETDANKIYKVVFKFTGVNIDTDVRAFEHVQNRTTASIATATTQGAYYNSDNTAVNFRPTRVGICNAAADFTIELYNYKGDPLASGTYSIADYMDVQNDALKAEGADTVTITKALNRAKGLYFFAQAAFDYKVTTPEESN